MEFDANVTDACREYRKPFGGHDEPIVLTNEDVDWAARFREEAMPLRCLLEPIGLLRIEHVGSTAVPGIVAKPVLDVAAGMASMEPVYRLLLSAWHAIGYDGGPTGELPDWCYFLKRDDEGARIVHLHVIPNDSAFMNDIVDFRDALRCQPQFAREYEAEKITQLARAASRNDYRDGKTPAVESILKRYRAMGRG